jgi:hypothetical protein
MADDNRKDGATSSAPYDVNGPMELAGRGVADYSALRGFTVLIVEDEIGIIRAARTAFEEHGTEVIAIDPRFSNDHSYMSKKFKQVGEGRKAIAFVDFDYTERTIPRPGRLERGTVEEPLQLDGSDVVASIDASRTRKVPGYDRLEAICVRTSYAAQINPESPHVSFAKAATLPVHGLPKSGDYGTQGVDWLALYASGNAEKPLNNAHLERIRNAKASRKGRLLDRLKE